MSDEQDETPESVPDPEPIYRHNCSRCQFLGSAEFEDRVYDLYYCRQGHLFPTVIARGSSDSHDYTSGMALAAIDPVLREAYERAKDKGFISLDSQPENEDN
jgi:hypothetical protein